LEEETEVEAEVEEGEAEAEGEEGECLVSLAGEGLAFSSYSARAAASFLSRADWASSS
jgi:hypothetical protein